MPLNAEASARLFQYCTIFNVSRNTFDAQLLIAQEKAAQQQSLGRKFLYQWLAKLDPQVSGSAPVVPGPHLPK